MSSGVLGYPSALWSTVLFLAIFVLAFFPSLFIAVLELPFQLIVPAKPTRGTPLPSIPTPAPPIAMTSWFQKTITLPARSRGSYLITDEIVRQLPEIKQYRVGILHLFVQHTSCGLTMNENWDEDVRADMSDALDRIVPRDNKGTLYRHSAEGSDDMPAHVKSALIGSSVSIPVTQGKIQTGTWQGVWLCEFRDAKHTRKIVATINGEKMS